MALSNNLVLFGDISVAFMNTPTPEGVFMYMDSPEGFRGTNNNVLCLKTH